VVLSREQRDWINAAAAALEDHVDHDEDPLAMLEAAELRRVVGDWDGARDWRSAEPVEQRLRDALRQIAGAESGIWGWVARDALDEREATNNGGTDARGDGAPATPGHAIAARGQGAQARR
jgi:hypothetical protein